MIIFCDARDPSLRVHRLKVEAEMIIINKSGRRINLFWVTDPNSVPVKSGIENNSEW